MLWVAFLISPCYLLALPHHRLPAYTDKPSSLIVNNHTDYTVSLSGQLFNAKRGRLFKRPFTHLSGPQRNNFFGFEDGFSLDLSRTPSIKLRCAKKGRVVEQRVPLTHPFRPISIADLEIQPYQDKQKRLKLLISYRS